MTNSGIDIEKESIDLAVAFCFLAEGKPSELWPSIKALCLRVEEAATKAEREACAEIARINNQKHIGHAGDYDAGANHCSALILSEILSRNGETKNG